MNDGVSSNRLGENLRARRDLATPDQAGIPVAPTAGSAGVDQNYGVATGESSRSNPRRVTKSRLS